eukprot:2799280-Ditylum_brightwellii.AAC.1
MKEAEEAIEDIVLITNKNDDGNPDEKSHQYVIDDNATAEKCSMVKDAFEEYGNLPANVKKVWGMKKRQNLEKQPLIRDDIIHIIRSNPKLSWD